MVLLVVGVVLFATGAAGLAFLPLVLCGLMIGAMMWMMMRSGRDGRGDR